MMMRQWDGKGVCICNPPLAQRGCGKDPYVVERLEMILVSLMSMIEGKKLEVKEQKRTSCFRADPSMNSSVNQHEEGYVRVDYIFKFE